MSGNISNANYATLELRNCIQERNANDRISKIDRVHRTFSLLIFIVKILIIRASSAFKKHHLIQEVCTCIADELLFSQSLQNCANALNRIKSRIIVHITRHNRVLLSHFVDSLSMLIVRIICHYPHHKNCQENLTLCKVPVRFFTQFV